MEGHMHAGKGWMMLIIGILLILNEIFHTVSWVMLVGILFIIAAIFMFCACSCKDKKKR